jgi:hypothetical protein
VSESQYTRGTRESALYQNSQSSGRAPALDRLELGKLRQTRTDFGRASVFELRGGLPTGWEALQQSEPRHSLEKATPSYYTKNESFASGIMKMCRGFSFPQ